MKQTFKGFLAEQRNIVKQWNTTPLTTNNAINYLLKNCKKSFVKAIKDGGLLFRGFKQLPGRQDECVIIDPSAGKRTSKDTNNLYQLMMDESESLKDYPSRSSSLICSTSPEYTTLYGENYAVIPKDNARLCYISVHDILDVPLAEKIWSYTRVSNLTIGGIKDTSLGRFFSGFNDPDEKFVDAGLINERMSKFTNDELTAIFLCTIGIVEEYFKDRFETSDPKIYMEFYEKIVLASRIGYGIGTFNNFAMYKLDYEDVQKHEELIRDLGKIMTRIDDSRAGSAINDFRELIRGTSRNSRFTDISTSIIRPDSLGLSLGQFGQKLKKPIECWTDSECLLIPTHTDLMNPVSVFSDILNESKELGLVRDLKEINKYYHRYMDPKLLKDEI